MGQKEYIALYVVTGPGLDSFLCLCHRFFFFLSRYLLLLFRYCWFWVFLMKKQHQQNKTCALHSTSQLVLIHSASLSLVSFRRAERLRVAGGLYRHRRCLVAGCVVS